MYVHEEEEKFCEVPTDVLRFAAEELRATGRVLGVDRESHERHQAVLGFMERHVGVDYCTAFERLFAPRPGSEYEQLAAPASPSALLLENSQRGLAARKVALLTRALNGTAEAAAARAALRREGA